MERTISVLHHEEILLKIHAPSHACHSMDFDHSGYCGTSHAARRREAELGCTRLFTYERVHCISKKQKISNYQAITMYYLQNFASFCRCSPWPCGQFGLQPKSEHSKCSRLEEAKLTRRSHDSRPKYKLDLVQLHWLYLKPAFSISAYKNLSYASIYTQKVKHLSQETS